MDRVREPDSTGMLRFDVAILGGGVAGLALAIFLRARGLDVAVFERSRADTTEGIAFMLMPNGLAVVDGMGLGGRVRGRGQAVFGVSEYSAQGELLEMRSIEEHLCMRRSDLLDVLAGELDNDALRFGADVVSFDEAADGTVAAAVLSDGTRVAADLFVGADGVHSILRRALYPTSATYPDQVHTWLSICRCPDIAGELSGRLMRMQHEGLVLGAAAVSDDEVLWFLHFSTARYGVGGRSGEDMAALVKGTVGGWANPVPDLIAHTDFASSRVCRTPDMDVPSMLWRTNTVLIGDAAHPLHIVTSQGANTALEDAQALDRCLTPWPSGGHLNTALARFDRERRPTSTARLADGRERIDAVVASLPASSNKTEGRRG